ncbi:hypothetical protein JCM10207_005072 [Rhodosporidiobolus poonsookiae]
MPPLRRPRPAAPLLSFPPSPPHPTLPRREEERPRSTAFKVLAFLPLVFIGALLGFAAYAVLWSLCIDYLLLRQHRFLKGFAYFALFAWLLFGCAGSVWMAYWRGGGIVPGAGEWKRADEEAQLGREGLKDEVERFVLDDEEDDEREVEEEPAEGATREEEALLGGQGQAGGGGDSRPRALQVKSDGKPRFCRKCNTFKPDRAHHCSSCRRCVLKMDHHCPWLGGGCVGWANYKFFLLFLWYTGALGIATGAILFHELVNFVEDTDQGFELAPITWALAALLGCIFGSAVGLFGLYHLYLACKNRSTIEAMEHPTSLATLAPPPSPSSHPSASHPTPAQSHLSSLCSRAHRPRELTYKQRHRLAAATRRFNVYDLGAAENLRQIFGGTERWYEWGMPWGWPPGDGTFFPINDDNLLQLRRITEQIYREADGEVHRSSYSSEGMGSAASDGDGPIRRA